MGSGNLRAIYRYNLVHGALISLLYFFELEEPNVGLPLLE